MAGRRTEKNGPTFQEKNRILPADRLFLKDSRQGFRYPLVINSKDLMPAHRDDSLATRASLLGRLKNWEDEESWQEFVDTYSKLIIGVAVQSGLSECEAKDVEQETLLRVAQTIHEFKSSPERGSFKSWLLTLTRWRIADQFRKRSPSGIASDGTATGTGTATIERVPDPALLDAAWEMEWQKNLLETALTRIGRRVKPKHLQIFDLYAIRHWSAVKVARELGVSVVQVYLVNHRITKLMKLEVGYLEKKLQ
jgi:RNA polymerase sigma factor (sigma-70 family)